MPVSGSCAIRCSVSGTVVNVGAPEGETAVAAPGKAEGKEGEKKEAKPAAGPKVDRDALYIGKDGGPGARTGLKCFEEIDEIALVVVPGQTSPARGVEAERVLDHQSFIPA